MASAYATCMFVLFFMSVDCSLAQRPGELRVTHLPHAVQRVAPGRDHLPLARGRVPPIRRLLHVRRACHVLGYSHIFLPRRTLLDTPRRRAARCCGRIYCCAMRSCLRRRHSCSDGGPLARSINPTRDRAQLELPRVHVGRRGADLLLRHQRRVHDAQHDPGDVPQVR